jgi:tRNA pseudouridine55 synthase
MTTSLTKVPLVFNVFKPIGKSSFFPVHIFKRNLHYDYGKIGHFGTLDPFADGVLLIGVQGAQKMNDYVHGHMTKTYEAQGVFGKKTNSGDFESEIILEKEIEDDFKNMDLPELEDIIGENFLGEYWQSPHAVSAAKYKGRRLYKYALKGQFIELEKRKRDIKKFEIIEYNYPNMKFKIEVSSGTYIRSFFEDVADFLGGVGTLKSLTRTKIGIMDISDSIRPDDWPKEKTEFNLEKFGISIDKLFPLNEIRLSEYSARRYLLGQRAPVEKAEFVNIPSPSSENIYWLYSDNELLGMGKVVEGRITTVFNLPVAIERYSL